MHCELYITVQCSGLCTVRESTVHWSVHCTWEYSAVVCALYMGVQCGSLCSVD